METEGKCQFYRINKECPILRFTPNYFIGYTEALIRLSPIWRYSSIIDCLNDSCPIAKKEVHRITWMISKMDPVKKAEFGFATLID